MPTPANFKDLTGQRFGRLVVLHRVGSSGRHVAWKCRCDCGSERTVSGNNLTRGLSGSCECLQKGQVAARRTTHGMTGHPAYRSWFNMIQRCTNPCDTAWKYYGGRGITVCPEWRSFTAFWTDMGPARAPGLTLDRIDNDGNSEPGNCQWATRKEQMRNRRNTRRIDTPKWGHISIGEAAERSGLPYNTLQARIKLGWEVDWLFEPPHRRRLLLPVRTRIHPAILRVQRAASQLAPTPTPSLPPVRVRTRTRPTPTTPPPSTLPPVRIRMRPVHPVAR